MSGKELEDKTPTHINGAKVTAVTEHKDPEKRNISCEDGNQYVWHTETEAVYPAGHPRA